MPTRPERWTNNTQEAFSAAGHAARPQPPRGDAGPSARRAAGAARTPTAPLLAQVGVDPDLAVRNRVASSWPSCRAVRAAPAPGCRARRAGGARGGRRERGATWATTTSRSSTSCWPWPTRSGSPRMSCSTALREVRGNHRVTTPEPRGDLPGPGEVRPRPHRGGPPRASSTRSSAATRRSAASSRCCPGAPRTTRCSSASPASARRRSSRGWPTASLRATCPRG